MFAKIDNVEIVAVAGAIPSTSVDLIDRCNGDISAKKAKRMIGSVGFDRFTVARDGMTAGDLCYAAAEQIFETLNYDKDNVDAIIFLSQMPDYVSPPTSSVLQAKLGIKSHALAIDVNHGCPGYGYGLYIAASLINGGCCESVLLCVGDTKSKVLFPTDLSTRTIFGDGGSATLITKGKKSVFFSINSYGDKHEAIMTKRGAGKLPHVSLGDSDYTDEKYRENFLKMDGVAVMDFTLSEVPRMIAEFSKHFDFDLNEIDLYAIHQANKMIVESIADNLKLDREKVPFVAQHIGNTSSASIPLLLAGLNKKILHSRVLISGFGVGLAIASAVVDLSNTQFCGIVELN